MKQRWDEKRGIFRKDGTDKDKRREMEAERKK